MIHRDAWSLHWDSGEGSAVCSRDAAHAVRNDGTEDLYIVGLSDGEYDPAAPDAYPRRVSGNTAVR